MTLKEFKRILNMYDENLEVVANYDGDLVKVEDCDIGECEGYMDDEYDKFLRILDVDTWLCR